MNRKIKPCRCKYQMEQPWGYSIYCRDESTYWKEIAVGRTTDEALALADPFPVVLIKCRGCGDELLREYDAVGI